KAVGRYHEDEELPDLLAGEQVEVYEPEAVLATRKIQQQGEESQVDVSLLHEELIHYESSGPKIWKVYSRRGKRGNSG
ncbi:hypothetical protein A2U01_0043991, partial [Trifolium medium]|nr:hypothetical protein [Trifolium medium]